MGRCQAETAAEVIGFDGAVTAARADRSKGSIELAETLAKMAQF